MQPISGQPPGKAHAKRVFGIGRTLLQFFPLTVFVRVAFWHGAPQTADWFNAFVWGGCAALLQTVVSGLLARGHQPLNRIMLGVNGWLIFGGCAVLSNQMELLKVFQQLRESGIFLCLLVVGLCSTFASKAGFVGATDVSMQPTIRQYSLVLLALTCAALLASFLLQGQQVFSAAIPLILLSVATRLFKRRLQRNLAVQ